MGLTQVSKDGVKNDAIDASKLPANSVGASELADNAVDTNAISNNAVTAGKLASGVQTTINNNADNRVITGSGTANTLNGESGLLFDGTQLQIGGDSGFAGTWGLEVYNTSSNVATGLFAGLQGAEVQIRDLGSSECLKLAANGQASIQSLKAGDPMVFFTAPSGGSTREVMRLVNTGEVGINITNPETYGISGTGYGGLTVQAPSGGYSGITIRSSYAGGGALFFADGNGSNAERKNLGFAADHVNKRMNFIVEGSTVCRFTANGFHPNPADSAAANALDDYEEGTFSPTLLRATSNPSASFYTRFGRYTKIGNLVHVQLMVDAYNVSGGSGQWQVGNFPFATENADVGHNNPMTNARIYLDGDYAMGVDGSTLRASYNSSTWLLYNQDDDTSVTGNFSRVIFQGSITYRTDS